MRRYSIDIFYKLDKNFVKLHIKLDVGSNQCIQTSPKWVRKMLLANISFYYYIKTLTNINFNIYYLKL